MSNICQSMSKEEYLTWLERLSRQKLPAAGLLPALLVEDPGLGSAQLWAEELLTPMVRLKLFPFQGEVRWVQLDCLSWEQVEHLPVDLARLCASAAGLYGSFRGGAVLDLRRCPGKPPRGGLKVLEDCLYRAGGQLCPLILVAPGAGEAVQRQLSLLDLQQLTPRPGECGGLEEILERTDLTQGERELVLCRARRCGPEQVEGLLRTLRRMCAVGDSPGAAQLLARLEPESKTRQIGFGREGEHGVY